MTHHTLVESFQRPHVVDLEPLVVVHPNNLSRQVDEEEVEDMEKDDEEEDNTKVKGEDEARVIHHTQ